MKTEKHYQILNDIAESSFNYAINSVEEYETENECFDSYSNNTGDTVREIVKGWDWEDVSYTISVFCNLVAQYKKNKN